MIIHGPLTSLIKPAKTSPDSKGVSKFDHMPIHVFTHFCELFLYQLPLKQTDFITTKFVSHQLIYPVTHDCLEFINRTNISIILFDVCRLYNV